MSKEDFRMCSSEATKANKLGDKLTPEQVKNWRMVLVGMIGPFALVIPAGDIQKIRDQMQAKFGEPDPTKLK